MIKPNETEIKDVINKDIDSIEYLKEILSKKPFKDIKNIIVSMGKYGILVKMSNMFYKAIVPTIDVVNPVSSGDSSLAGVLSGIEDDEIDIDIIKKSMNCGLLNAFNPEISKIDMDLFDKYYEKIKVEEI